MYGLPLCFAIFYRIKENLKMKRRVTEPEKFIHRGAELIIEK